MKAIVVHQFGGPDVLTLEDAPDPTPGPGEVVVRLHAAGVNPVETYIRSGQYARLPALPYTPGADGAGEVAAVGDGVTTVKVGDRVYVAAMGGAPSSGTYAERVRCAADLVHPLPDRLSFAQGAAVGIPYATAWRALHQKAHVQPGETVLVHGASGGVGTAAVQIARAAGAVVLGTAGTEAGLTLVRAQGAREAFNHHAPDYAEAIKRATNGRGPDVIVEMLANVNFARDFDLIAPHGRVIIVGSRAETTFTPRAIMAKEAIVTGFTLPNSTAADRQVIHAGLGAGFALGALTPVIARELPLAEAARAHAAVHEGGALGKIVLAC